MWCRNHILWGFVSHISSQALPFMQFYSVRHEGDIPVSLTLSSLCFCCSTLTSPDSVPALWLASMLAAPANHIVRPSSFWEQSAFCCCTTCEAPRKEGKKEREWEKEKTKLIVRKLIVILNHILTISLFSETKYTFEPCLLTPNKYTPAYFETPCEIVHFARLWARCVQSSHTHTQTDTACHQQVSQATITTTGKNQTNAVSSFAVFFPFLSVLLKRRERKKESVSSQQGISLFL